MAKPPSRAVKTAATLRKRINDISTVAWLWSLLPSGVAAVIAAILAYGEGLPKAVVLLIALGVLALVMLLLAGWRVWRMAESQTDEERIYQEELVRRRALLRAEEQAEREAAGRKVARSLGFGNIGDAMATAFEEMEKDRRAEAEARRLRLLREASQPAPPPAAARHGAPPSPAKPQWIPFHQALHYIVYDSRWSAGQPAVASEDEFNRIVCAEVQERLARGEIASRGRRGWGPEARKRATEEISKEFWVDAFFLPWGSIAQGRHSDDAAGKQGGGGEQWSGIILDDVAVRKVWPRRTFPPGASKEPTPLSAMIEGLRAKCAEGNAELERQKIELAPRQSGGDLSHIGKAILDRYHGEVEVFAYRKAVLQLSEVIATASRHADAKHLSRLDCHMDIENHTKQPFRKCRVRLAAINGERLEADTFLRIGKLKGEDTETEFAVRPGHSKSRINFMKRDLDDVVSNPPFVLCLNDRDFPLSDGKEYKFVFALECEYDHPTYATVRFYVPEREKVEIELLSQSLDMPDD